VDGVYRSIPGSTHHGSPGPERAFFMPDHSSPVRSALRDRILDERHPAPSRAVEVAYKDTSFKERRRHPRSPLTLHGRYMLSDGSEFPCETVDVSPGGIAIKGLKAGQLGERVVVYIEDLGRIEGGVLRSGASGLFTVEIRAPSKKQERLAETIAWLVKNKEDGLSNRRNRRRIDAAHEPMLLRTVDGLTFAAKLIDVSTTGAALLIDIALPIGAHVSIDDKPASVSRRFPGGVAVTFRETAPERVREILALAEENMTR
jgi:c-di-GMP-binding flagellar brake protein YcgR